MLSEIHQSAIKSQHILKHFLKDKEIVKHSNKWDPLSSKPQIKKIKEYHAKNKEARMEEAPVAFTRKPQVYQTPQEGKHKKKNNWTKPYSPSYRIPKIPKDSMDNVFNMSRTLI
ncbi:hypothetical protein O181_054358 [Austropuccinia psidii MF-1]|uniref:Uncharacterized protein n=1 Tax=Austropuccinia psidii MF-1 TaxID=1389203 RepID=A0A9Q3HRC5_9BASI|nr:hypothetical protein [Austropuccinia psidii MF-1]